jgi:hypothetical protein
MPGASYFCRMTKVVLTALAVVLTGLQFSSCKKEKEKDTDVVANANKGKVVCRVDGKEWISDAASKLYKVTIHDTFLSYTQDIYGTQAYIFGDTLYISGAKVAGTDSSAIDFTIVLRENRIGSYTIGAYPPAKAGTAASCYYNKLGIRNLATAYSGYNTTGSFEITGFNDSLKFFSGKFNFNMSPKNSGNPKTPSHTVTDGVFIDAKLD